METEGLIDLPELQLVCELGGACPVQGEGSICGFALYFYARSSNWYFAVSFDPSVDPVDVSLGAASGFLIAGTHGHEHEAGYMPFSTSQPLIERCARRFLADYTIPPLAKRIFILQATARDGTHGQLICRLVAGAVAIGDVFDVCVEPVRANRRVEELREPRPVLLSGGGRTTPGAATTLSCDIDLQCRETAFRTTHVAHQWSAGQGVLVIDGTGVGAFEPGQLLGVRAEPSA